MLQLDEMAFFLGESPTPQIQNDIFLKKYIIFKKKLADFNLIHDLLR